MDVAVITSTQKAESFEVPAVEALTCGTPMIISVIPGLIGATDPYLPAIVAPRKVFITIENAIDKCAKWMCINASSREFMKK